MAAASPARYFSGWNCPCSGNAGAGRCRTTVKRARSSRSTSVRPARCAASQLLVECSSDSPRRNEEIAVDAREVAVDASPRGRSARWGRWRRVWLSAARRAPSRAVQTLDLVVAVVERVHQVRGGAAGLARRRSGRRRGRRRLAPSLRQQVRGRQAGDARADDAHVGRASSACNGVSEGVSAVAIQTEVVCPDSLFITPYARRLRPAIRR